jgi:hypothetical protein
MILSLPLSLLITTQIKNKPNLDNTLTSFDSYITAKAILNLFFSLNKKMQFKFFYLFTFKLFSLYFQTLHKRKRRTLIRGIKGPKKSFNTYLIKSHYLILSLFSTTGFVNILLFSYLVNQNYFNLVKFLQFKKYKLILETS